MSKELKRNKCLEKIEAITCKANPSLETSGRYIKTLRKSQNLSKDNNEKMKYEYVINKYLQKHMILLQESAINSYGKKPDKRLSLTKGEFIKNLAKSEYGVGENKYTLVDVDCLKQFKMLEKSVILKDDLVLSCKVKSENQKYRFNTQIIMSQNNVLGYTTNEYEYDYSLNNVNHNVLLTKVGSGIKNNELLEKSKQIAR